MRLRRLFVPTEQRHHYHRTYSLNVKSFANAVMYIKYIQRPIVPLEAQAKKKKMKNFTFPLFIHLLRSFVRFHSLCTLYNISGVKSGSFQREKKESSCALTFSVLATFIHQGFDFYFFSLILCCCCFFHTQPSWPRFSTFISIKHVPR